MLNREIGRIFPTKLKIDKMKLSELTSNQYYKGLNNRFDNRVKKLLRKGFTYCREKAAYKDPRWISTNPNAYVSNSVIMHSDKRHFNSLLPQ